MFVVDDLVGWLIGQLANAGYKKLTTLLRGSDQARALKQAVTAAVQVTVGEIGPSDGVEADEVAEQINKAFRRRDPVPLPPGQPTPLEALQAGIAGQLSVPDDAGQPVVSLPGVQVSEVAAKLTGHLVREIMIRGSQGGPLTPLADQLNHDLTHLQGQRLEGQGQRVEGMLAQLLDWLGGGPPPPGRAAGPVGWPLAEVGDPFALEVHRPVQPEDSPPGLPVLPAYVPRDHDAELGSVVRAAADGSSGIAVLVGGSSTGKTRACWEALGLLRGRPEPWQLWHPIDPTRPDAALRELPAVGPRTVVWLNEAQFYLDPTDGQLGEQVAAGLRELLRDPARAPVLVLATLWPEYWHGLTARPAGGADPHAQARELLDGHDITVPAAFTVAQLQQLDQAGDARLAQAAAGAQDGQIIQFLAGVPELLARYRNAPPAAAALIHAAMDARRLGMGSSLPRAFLEAAAPGYLTDTEWDALDDDWLKRALDYTAKDAKGVRGPLTRIRPRPARPGAGGSGSENSDEQLADGQAGTAGGPLYRLADYLDQHGRTDRKGQIPPPGFWDAAAAHAFPADQAALGYAAHARGLYRAAAQLRKNAAARGNLESVFYLADPSHWLLGDARPVRWAIARAPLDDPSAVGRLLGTLLEADAPREQVTVLLQSDPATHVSLESPYAVAHLLDRLREADAPGQVTALAGRAAAHAPLENPAAVARLLDSLRDADAPEQVTALAGRAAAHTSLDDPRAVARLLDSLREADAPGQVTALADRAAAHASLDDPDGVAELLRSLRRADAQDQATALAGRAAANAPLENPAAAPEQFALDPHPLDNPAVVARLVDEAAHSSLKPEDRVAWLLGCLRQADAQDQATALADRAAADASLDDLYGVSFMLNALHTWGTPEQVAVLADRAAAYSPVEHSWSVALVRLLGTLREVGADEQVTALADRAAAHASVEDPGAAARLLDALGAFGAPKQVTTVLADRAAAHASLENPGGVAWLLRSLPTGGGQVAALLHRDPAAHASLYKSDDVAKLLDSLRKVGAPEQVTALVNQLPGAGMFELFRQQRDPQDQFRFGREADGSPAKRWDWGDLD